jgi:hypothetical protein
VTSLEDAGSRPWGRPAGPRGATWPRVAVIGGVLLLAFFVARSCQQSQIRITKEQAIATAEQQVSFTPENTQVRLLRQGLAREPIWIVSLSIPSRGGADESAFSQLSVVRIDANTGEVVEVIRQQGQPQGSEP